MTNPLVFDRAAVRRHRDRAARLGSAEFLFDAAVHQLVDRLDDVTRSFARALVVRARRGSMARALESRGGIELVTEMDDSLALLAWRRGAPRVVAEAEEAPFPIAVRWRLDP